MSTLRMMGSGLSPRAWGSRVEHSIGISPRQVYPHGRGGAGAAGAVGLVVEGLSPRAWGSRDPSAYCVMPIRSIPTGVGEPAAHLSE